MLRLLITVCCCCLFLFGSAQVSDIISVRKPNGRIIKSFYAGSPITFNTHSGIMLNGTIREIRNDSVLLNSFVTRIVPTRLGVTVVDTFARWIEKLHYKDIKNIEVFYRSGFARRRIGPLLIIGGGGYMLLNIVNGIYLNQPITSKENLRSLGTAAAALGSGILMQKLFKPTQFSRRRHHIRYINVR